MRSELEELERIELYLEGKLTGEGLRAFEAQLQADEAFYNEVHLQELVQTRFQTMGLYAEIQAAHYKFVKHWPGTGLGGKIISFILLGTVSFAILFTGYAYREVSLRQAHEPINSEKDQRLIPSDQHPENIPAIIPVIRDSLPGPVDSVSSNVLYVPDNVPNDSVATIPASRGVIYHPAQFTALFIPLKEDCQLMIPAHFSFIDANGNLVREDVSVLCDYKGNAAEAVPKIAAHNLSQQSPLYELAFIDQTGTKVFPAQEGVKITTINKAVQVRYLDGSTWKAAPESPSVDIKTFDHVPDGYEIVSNVLTEQGNEFIMYENDEGKMLARKVEVKNRRKKNKDYREALQDSSAYVDSTFSKPFTPTGPFWDLLPRETEALPQTGTIDDNKQWPLNKPGYFILGLPPELDQGK